MAGSGRGGGKRRRRVALLRGIGFAAAVAIGIVSVWLIATGGSTRSIRIGALAGFWSLLLGAFAIFGSKAPQREPEPAPAPLPLLALASGSRELDVRQVGEIERAAVAAARREFQAELEQMLRREVQAGLASEVAGLRSEVAALRNELVEKVGGQLRLERIETTRLIGSDLEALQHELRQLRHVGTSDFDDFDESFGKSLEKSAGPAAAVSGAKLGDGTVLSPVPLRVPDIQDAEVVPEPVVPEPVVPEPVVPESVVPEPAVVTEPEPVLVTERAVAPEPEPVVAPEPAAVSQINLAPPVTSAPAAEVAAEPTTATEPAPPAEPAAFSEPAAALVDPAPEPVQTHEPKLPPTNGTPADPFASMPRLSRFTDYDLDPVPAGSTSDNAAAASGRHSTGDNPGGRAGRRHRADDSENDTLARILARETQ